MQLSIDPRRALKIFMILGILAMLVPTVDRCTYNAPGSRMVAQGDAR